MTYEIRIRKRDTNAIWQQTYEVPKEMGEQIESMCKQLVPKQEDETLYADATPIEFGCNEDGCKI